MGFVRDQFEKLRADGLEVKQLKEKLKMAEAMAERVTAAIGGECVSSSKSKSPMENAAEKALELRERLAEIEPKHQRDKLFLQGTIGLLSNEYHRKVLSGYYIDCKTKTEVGREVGYTFRHIYNIIDSAFKVLEEMIE